MARTYLSVSRNSGLTLADLICVHPNSCVLNMDHHCRTLERNHYGQHPVGKSKEIQSAPKSVYHACRKEKRNEVQRSAPCGKRPVPKSEKKIMSAQKCIPRMQKKKNDTKYNAVHTAGSVLCPRAK